MMMKRRAALLLALLSALAGCPSDPDGNDDDDTLPSDDDDTDDDTSDDDDDTANDDDDDDDTEELDCADPASFFGALERDPDCSDPTKEPCPILEACQPLEPPADALEMMKIQSHASLLADQAVCRRRFGEEAEQCRRTDFHWGYMRSLLGCPPLPTECDEAVYREMAPEIWQAYRALLVCADQAGWCYYGCVALGCPSSDPCSPYDYDNLSMRCREIINGAWVGKGILPDYFAETLGRIDRLIEERGLVGCEVLGSRVPECVGL